MRDERWRLSTNDSTSLIESSCCFKSYSEAHSSPHPIWCWSLCHCLNAGNLERTTGERKTRKCNEEMNTGCDGLLSIEAVCVCMCTCVCVDMRVRACVCVCGLLSRTAVLVLCQSQNDSLRPHQSPRRHGSTFTEGPAKVKLTNTTFSPKTHRERERSRLQRQFLRSSQKVTCKLSTCFCQKHAFVWLF